MAETIEHSLRDLLLTLSAVTDIVGTGGSARIRPDRLGQQDTRPGIMVEVDLEEPQNSLDGKGGLVYARVTISCRAVTKAVSRTLAEAVRTNNTDPGTGLAGYHGVAGSQEIDAVLEDTITSFNSKDDGSDEGWYDTDALYVVSFHEVT